mmetsp:Transcript_960/g.2994  ORF Transcript_960/g.2994 Transcript_960/m.2994 type:complete len:365 (-) Transcript_960:755-1849(-)
MHVPHVTDVVARVVAREGVDGRRPRVEAAPPELELLLAVLRFGLLLGQTGERAVHPLVEPPRLVDGDRDGVELRQHQPGCLNGARQPRGVDHVDCHAVSGQHPAGGDGLGPPLRRQLGVLPAGEKAQLVVVRLAVPDDDHPLPALPVGRARSRRRSSYRVTPSRLVARRSRGALTSRGVRPRLGLRRRRLGLGSRPLGRRLAGGRLGRRCVPGLVPPPRNGVEVQVGPGRPASAGLLLQRRHPKGPHRTLQISHVGAHVALETRQRGAGAQHRLKQLALIASGQPVPCQRRVPHPQLRLGELGLIGKELGADHGVGVGLVEHAAPLRDGRAVHRRLASLAWFGDQLAVSQHEPVHEGDALRYLE